MSRLPQQTRNSEVYRVPSEEYMQRIQKFSYALLLIYSCSLVSHISPAPTVTKYKRYFTEMHVSMVQIKYLQFSDTYSFRVFYFPLWISQCQWPCDRKTQNGHRSTENRVLPSKSMLTSFNCEMQCRKTNVLNANIFYSFVQFFLLTVGYRILCLSM